MTALNWDALINYFAAYPDGEWFLNTTVRDQNSLQYNIFIPLIGLWCLKIPPSAAGQHTQLVVRGWHNVGGYGDVTDGLTVHIYTYPGETPRWGNISGLEMGHVCSNMGYAVYTGAGEYERTQTWGILAAIQAERDAISSIISAVAKNDSLNIGILSAIQGQPELPITVKAAIRGDVEKEPHIRAAIRKDQILEPGIEAAVAKDFEMPDSIRAAIQGNPQINIGTRAAIKGDAQKTVSIVAYIQVRRIDQIKLEMENLVPQELDIRSTPNWRSKVKDWRTESLG